MLTPHYTFNGWLPTPVRDGGGQIRLSLLVEQHRQKEIKDDALLLQHNIVAVPPYQVTDNRDFAVRFWRS